MSTQTGQGIRLGNQYAFAANAQTGSGAQQTIPHGLNRTPDLVLVQPSDPATATVTEISWDSTNVYVTVTLNKVYSVLALVF